MKCLKIDTFSRHYKNLLTLAASEDDRDYQNLCVRLQVLYTTERRHAYGQAQYSNNDHFTMSNSVDDCTEEWRHDHVSNREGTNNDSCPGLRNSEVLQHKRQERNRDPIDHII